MTNANFQCFLCIVAINYWSLMRNIYIYNNNCIAGITGNEIYVL